MRKQNYKAIESFYRLSELLPIVNRMFLLSLVSLHTEVNLTIEEAFGQVIKELRKARYLSQEKLALASNLDRSFISHLERGYKQPSLITIFQLAKTLKISPSQLIALVEEKCRQFIKKRRPILVCDRGSGPLFWHWSYLGRPHQCLITTAISYKHPTQT